MRVSGTGVLLVHEIAERADWIAEGWPLGKPGMAWYPPGANPDIAAVPIGPEDVRNGLKERTYMLRLSARLRWMLVAEHDPAATLRDVAEALRWRDLCSLLPDDEALQPSDRLGRRIEGNAMLIPELLPLLALPDEEPWAVANSQEAVWAVRTARLAAWIDLVT